MPSPPDSRVQVVGGPPPRRKLCALPVAVRTAGCGTRRTICFTRRFFPGAFRRWHGSGLEPESR